MTHLKIFSISIIAAVLLCSGTSVCFAQDSKPTVLNSESTRTTDEDAIKAAEKVAEEAAKAAEEAAKVAEEAKKAAEEAAKAAEEATEETKEEAEKAAEEAAEAAEEAAEAAKAAAEAAKAAENAKNALVLKALINKGWHREKEDVFRLANEQDKYIFLLVGRYTCPNCQVAVGRINGENKEQLPDVEQLQKLIGEEYILWYSHRDSVVRKDEVKIYTDQPYQGGNPQLLPMMHVINPMDPTKVVISRWGSSTTNMLINMLTYNLPLKDLTWHENKDKVFNLAKSEGKPIFKFVGRGTSNNSQNVMKLLNESPLKEILQENYILWYSKYDDETRSGEVTRNDEVSKVPPFISIINPEEPNNYIVEEWGNKDLQALNNILKDGLVSNENINSLSENKVTVNDNILYISNNTDNEVISIYSITGQQIYTTDKKAQNITINATSFPSGILVINSSSGWSAKVIK